ncbi:hypothetical protein ACQ4PT_026806 [Festuca glaucescens]
MWTMRVLVLAVLLCGGIPWGAVCAPAANPMDVATMQAIAKSIGWSVKSSDPCDGTWAGLQRDLGSFPVLPTPLQFLRNIDLGSNSFYGLHHDFFAGLPSLETIVLDNNDLKVSSIEQADVVPCSRLRSFSANNASLHDHFPNFFGNVTLFPDLEGLSLARNHLWGVVHTGFGANSKISYLDIGGQTQNDDEKIDGHMDLFIPGMVNLVEAHLDHNGFSGLMPDATQLVNLRFFDASYNDLCGVPKFLGGTVVDLNGNPRVGGGCYLCLVICTHTRYQYYLNR